MWTTAPEACQGVVTTISAARTMCDRDQDKKCRLISSLKCQQKIPEILVNYRFAYKLHVTFVLAFVRCLIAQFKTFLIVWFTTNWSLDSILFPVAGGSTGPLVREVSSSLAQPTLLCASWKIRVGCARLGFEIKKVGPRAIWRSREPRTSGWLATTCWSDLLRELQFM